MTFMLQEAHPSATAPRPTQVATHLASRTSVSTKPVTTKSVTTKSVINESATTKLATTESATTEPVSKFASSTPVSATPASNVAPHTDEMETFSLLSPSLLSPSLVVQPALSLQVSPQTSPTHHKGLETVTPTSPSATAFSATACSASKDGWLEHRQAAASIGISPGLLNCYVAIYRSLGGQMPVQHHKQPGRSGFVRRYDPELVAGFASVRQQVREGADIRSAMAALQLHQHDARPSKKRKQVKLEQLLELNAHLSQQVSELRHELTASKQQTAPDTPRDNSDMAA